MPNVYDQPALDDIKSRAAQIIGQMQGEKEGSAAMMKLELEEIEHALDWKSSHLDGICRLRFRTKNDYGANSIRTKTFKIENGKVWEIDNAYGSFDRE